MGQSEDLFSLTYTTAEGEQIGLPEAYVAQRALADIAELITHPDNAHVGMVEVRRIGRMNDATKPNLTAVPLTDDNADAGWGGQVWTASDYEPRGFFTTRPEVLADKLVKLLSDRATERFVLSW